MKKFLVFFLLTGYLYIFSSQVSAQTSLAQNLKCDVSIYKVFQNSSLPYSNNGTLVPSGTRTNFDSYYIYSLNLKNTLAVPPLTSISRVFTTNISGSKEPITVLDYKMYPPGSTCIKNTTDNTISCNANFQFLNSTNGFVQVLAQVNRFGSDQYNTSTLFTVETDQGKVECATMLMLDSTTPISSETPVNWTTQFASLSARELMIMIGSNKYFRGKEPVSVRSDPYSDDSGNTYTTLETIWYEDPFANNVILPKNPVEMRLYMYFAREGNTWRLTETRTYNGNNPGDWFYYTPMHDENVTAKVGQPYKSNLVFRESSGREAQIICNGCSINAFMDLATANTEAYSISSSSDSNIMITNEPGTWFTIKVGLQSKVPFQAENKRYDWDFNPSDSLNLESLRGDGSLIRINGEKVGNTKLRVTAYDTSNNQLDFLATKEFSVNILDSKINIEPQCTYINQPIFSSKKAICCDGLSLIPTSDDQVGIVGYCVDKNRSDKEYDKLKAELDSVKSRLDKSEVKQTRVERIVSDIQSMLAKILKFLRLK